MALIIHHPKRVFAGAALAAAALLGALGWWVYPYAKWFYNTVPLVKFQAVCRVYDPNESDRLHFLNGKITQEFIVEILNRTHKYHAYAPNLMVSKGILYHPLSYLRPLPVDAAKFEGEAEEKTYIVTLGAPKAIFERRYSEGVFDGVDMSPYAPPQDSDHVRLDLVSKIHPDECGFLEELVIVGGRFAKPNPDAMP